MATYKEIQKEVRRRHGITVKICWIAHVKEEHRLTRVSAHNRRGIERVHPCPQRVRPLIEDVLRYFEMI